MSARAAVLIATASMALGGCASLGSPSTQSGTAASVAGGQATHEDPAPPAPRETAGAGAQSASAAVRRFATAYINWTARSVAADMRTLAAHCIGQARSALQLAAAQTAGDYELRHGGISNSGSVEAVAPLPGGRNRYVVVTRELTTATTTTAYEGLRPAWHVAIATVASTPGGRWVISGWQPET
jgi:hypothetical protein